MTVTVVGTNVSARVDAYGGFRLTGVPLGTVQVLFTGPGVNAPVVIENVGQQQRIQVAVTISGGAATLDNEQRSIEGTVTGLSGSCPNLSFTINGTTAVTTDGATRFEGGICRDVQNGTEVDVDGVGRAGGSVRATEVEFEEIEVELDGVVAGLSGSCPNNLSFTVNGISGTTAVTTDGATWFEGGTCRDVQNGTEVDVDGVGRAGGSVRATEVEFEEIEVELDGVVAGLSGSCPNNLSFTVNGINGTTAVTTDGATRFEGGMCRDVQNGTEVDVDGVGRAGGSVRATEVEFEEIEVELDGVVAGLSGSCPNNLSFTVNGINGTTAVTTDGATRFEGGICRDVQNGTEVDVDGVGRAGGSVRATEVEFEEIEVELDGVVAGLSGSCPNNLSFTVNGINGTTAVTTDGATRFEGGICRDVQNGTEVDVDGVGRAGGSVRATEVEFEDVELEGTVTGLSGSCPNLSFMINGTTVRTDGGAVFGDGACSDVQNGVQVEVEGLRQPDGSVRATEVKLED